MGEDEGTGSPRPGKSLTIITPHSPNASQYKSSFNVTSIGPILLTKKLHSLGETRGQVRAELTLDFCLPTPKILPLK